ncbi:porin [Vibrio campbellii]|uniref:porin n=1 Tax=Vibrio campbellii TaxID=680 RepID=UPI00210BBD05|nr:porin [Vibrio campbellii]UTZ40780.1 porin [Vibrio campbellii]
MKKTLVALAVAGISTSALAAGNIYDNGTTSFNVKGEIDTYVTTLKSKYQNVEKKTDLDIDVWAKIQIDSQHKVNEDITVFGSFEMQNGEGFGFDGDGFAGDDKNVQTDDLYFGANFGDNWGVAFGEIGDFGDSLDAITIDNTNEGLGYVDDYVNSQESRGHAASVKANFNNLTVIADAYLNQEENIDTAFGLSAQYAINDMFTVGASYQDQGKNEVDTLEYKVMGAAVRFNMDNFSAAVNYVAEEVNKADQDTWSAVAAYQMNEARVYTSFGFTSYEDNKDGNYYTLGADYALTGNILTFIEYSSIDEDQGVGKTELDEGHVVVAGVYYTF